MPGFMIVKHDVTLKVIKHNVMCVIIKCDVSGKSVMSVVTKHVCMW